MHTSIQKHFESLKHDYKTDYSVVYTWVKDHIDLLDKNHKWLFSNKSHPIILEVLIIYLLNKNDLLQASYYLYAFKKSIGDGVAFRLLCASYSIKSNSYDTAYELLISVLKQAPQGSNTWLMLIECCCKNKWLDRGIFFSKKALTQQEWKPKTQLELKTKLNNFYFTNYEFKKSIFTSQDILQSFLDLDMFFIDDADKLPFKPEVAMTALGDFIALCEADEVKAFPIAGTLLGLHRDGALMPYDKDIDIAISTEDSMDIIKVIIEKNPRYSIDTDLIHINTYMSIYDKKLLVTIDILKFWEEDGKFYYGWQLPGKYEKESRLLTFTPFHLVKRKFKEQELYTPNNCDLFLSELYGNWKIPDPYYYSVLANNLQKITSLSEAISYRFLIASLRHKKEKKAITIINALQHWGNKDPLLVEIKKKYETKI